MAPRPMIHCRRSVSIVHGHPRERRKAIPIKWAAFRSIAMLKQKRAKMSSSMGTALGRLPCLRRTLRIAAQTADRINNPVPTNWLLNAELGCTLR